MSYLLDTCFLSEFTRKNPHPKAVEWLKNQNETELYLSVLTIGELEKGIHQLSDGKKKRQIRDWFENFVRRHLLERALPVDEKIASKWGSMQAEAEKNGRRLPTLDSLIAATALVHDLVIVTRNVQDMEASGAKIFNPWE